MPCSASEIINKARSFLGTKEEPPGSNNVVFNTDYYGHAVSGNNYAWCAAFVWDMFRMCGASELYYDGKRTAYCPALQKWGRENNLSLSDVHAVRPGDLVLYDWNGNKTADHIGICVSATASTITTIEGNTDDAVREVTRYYSSVCAVIRPKYTEPTIDVNCATCPLRLALLDIYNKIKEETEK